MVNDKQRRYVSAGLTMLDVSDLADLIRKAVGE